MFLSYLALIVTIEQGQLQGKVSTDLNNNTFYSFQGIPYAKPPIGDLRFKAPQPPEPWEGVRDATVEGSKCYSSGLGSIFPDGSEDCLFLNVYTPELPTENTTLKAVMVWIYGGSFKYGSSSSDTYGPEFLLTEDIVLVTINYRLGIFGFMKFDDPSLEIPGNAALRDMIQALKWVQKNIKSFSGDPDNVTIFGESAGAISTHLLVLSPLTKGLFHRAISQSGTAVAAFAMGRNDAAAILAGILQTKSDRETYDLLVNLSPLALFEFYDLAVIVASTLGTPGGDSVFRPLIEHPSSEAVISEDPIKILRSGNYTQVPIIIGYNNKEALAFALTGQPPAMPSNFEVLVPPTLGVEPGTLLSTLISEQIKDFYYGSPGTELDPEIYYRFFTENDFSRDSIFAVQHHAETQPFPVYLYRVSVETSLNMMKRTFNITYPGVCHADELGYLFHMTTTPSIAPNSLEEISLKRFVKLWTNFAKTGNPNSEDLTGVDEWLPVKGIEEINFIDIGPEVVAYTDPEAKSMAFWRDIFKINPDY